MKSAISLFCRLGLAKLKTNRVIENSHESWKNRKKQVNLQPEITPLNYHALLLDKSNEAFINQDFAVTKTPTTSVNNSSTTTDSDGGNTSDFSFIRKSSPDDFCLDAEDLSENSSEKSPKIQEKRIGFLFDSTLTAFLMMGNLSPGLKNHAVTMFEVSFAKN